MSYSISNKTTFSEIDWNTFENRPPIKRTMPYCKEEQWYDRVPCCMSGYTVEHVLDLAKENGYIESPEAQFLRQYPCLNGPELDTFFEKFTRLPENSQSESETSAFSCILSSIAERLKQLLK